MEPKHSAIWELRAKLAKLPASFLQSKDGRRLQAKILWQVRKVDGREAAREVRMDLLMYSVMP